MDKNLPLLLPFGGGRVIFFVFGTKIIYGPPLFCWFYSLLVHFCVFAFGKLLVENNADFALRHKAFSVFAFGGFLVENDYTSLFCLCSDNNRKPLNPYGSRTLCGWG